MLSIKKRQRPGSRSMRTRRIAASLLLAALLAVVSTTATGSPAGAAFYHNGTSPHATGCDQSAHTVGWPISIWVGNTYVGSAYHRYSSVCQSQWLTIYTADGRYSFNPSVWRNGSSTSYYDAFDDWPYAGTTFTNQISPVGTNDLVCAGTHVYMGSVWQKWVFLGCR